MSPVQTNCFRLTSFFISVHSHLDWTAIQLSAHADMGMPCQRMNSNKTGMEWREDLVHNNGVPIKVAPKNLKLKVKLNTS